MQASPWPRAVALVCVLGVSCASPPRSPQVPGKPERQRTAGVPKTAAAHDAGPRQPATVVGAVAPVPTRQTRGTVHTTDGSPADVKAAIGRAAAGDTVEIPAGTFTYGTNGDVVWIDKPITLAGVGREATTIVIADTSGPYTNAAVRLVGGPTVRDLTVRGASAAENRTPFAAGGSSGWRLSNIEFDQTPGKGSYFVYVQGAAFGLIDGCTINGAAGNNELIFTRGPGDAWQTDDTIGTADNVYIEDCIFNGEGYVCDINSNGKAVVRFCTINGPMKVDGHGKASNTPPRGVRHMEIYHNSWNSPRNTWATVELRGGTGYVFDNVAASGILLLREYALGGSWPNFGRMMLPKDYPIDDQIGVGRDPKVGGSAPAYLWSNRMTDGTPWTRVDRAADAKAVEANGGVAFSEATVVAPDRDFFIEATDFDGSSGVGIGTRARMDAIRPKLAKVGFWVTDEGEWNSKHDGPDGRLYVWDGKAWVVNYTPYEYPHPLRTNARVFVSPQGGLFAGSVEVTLACSAEGAVIHYTRDGSDPATTSPPYARPLRLTESATIKAIAVREGRKEDMVAEAVFRKVEGADAVTASGQDSFNVPLNTMDGDLTTRWSAQGRGQWIQYDLGAVKTIESVRIAWFKGNERTSTFDVLASKDGEDWSTVLDRNVSSGKTLELEKHDLEDVSARYVRLVGHGNSSNEWNSITEFRIDTRGKAAPLGVGPARPAEARAHLSRRR